MRFFTKKEWCILISLFLLSFIPAFAGLLRIIEILGGPAIIPENPRVIANPLLTFMHILSAFIFCIFGAFQFLDSIRRDAPKWHRVNGSLVALAGIILGGSGLWMTHFFPLPIELQGNLLYVARLIFGAAMIIFILLGFAYIRNRQIALHRSSMIRAYALGQVASTQTLIGLVWLVVFRQESIGFTRDLLMTFAFMINIIIAEWVIIRLNKINYTKQASTIIALGS
jgi:hypothetical protein